jgi:4-hydroxybenzoate-CoA ligase
MRPAITADALGVPETFNVATYLVDRNVMLGRGTNVAIECGEASLTYEEVQRNVNRCGSALRRLGVRPEERVLLLLHDSPEFVYAFFGAIKIGAVPVPLNTLWKTADYHYVIRDARATALVISAPLLPAIQSIPPGERASLRHIIVASGPGGGGSNESTHSHTQFGLLLAQGGADLEAEPTHRDAPAYWQYSSGSTGKPKACVHLQHDMVVFAELFGKGVLGIGANDRCFSVAKLFFAYGLGNALIFPFSVGATSILWPGPPAPEPIYAVIERYRPTLFFSVPTGYGMLLAHTKGRSQGPAADRAGGGDFDLSSMRLAVSAGEALPAALYERFKARFGVDVIDGIGSTEAGHMFISNRPGHIRPGSPTPPGEIGNLWVSGDSVCALYWNQHEKTKDTIQGRWLRTGDKYTQDADGYYWYAGRTDDMLKVGGLWVSPIEVENALVCHPSVLECGVVGREDHDGLVKPMAFVVLRDGVSAAPDLGVELQQFVRTQLAEYKRPRWVEFLPELPKTATGKIQRFRLRDAAAAKPSRV